MKQNILACFGPKDGILSKRRKDETDKGKTNTGKRTNIFTGSENYFGSAKKYKLTC